MGWRGAERRGVFVRWAACFVFVPRVCVVGNMGRGEWEGCVCLERAKLCLCVFADGRVGEFLESKGLVDRSPEGVARREEEEEESGNVS